ncbi:hypothetical protein SPONL_1057 [uncultured Candidatus Thioglobus sp.]|nr:hypothetical protein SPONL_1057 [uncultured Candidatus Thioglobus sp.]
MSVPLVKALLVGFSLMMAPLLLVGVTLKLVTVLATVTA